MQDLSRLARGSLAVTSQAGGNMQSSSKLAMTAAGSSPVDPVPDRSEQGDPAIDIPATQLKTGTDGKPQASGQAGPWKPAAPRWGPATAPGVLREKQGGSA